MIMLTHSSERIFISRCYTSKLIYQVFFYRNAWVNITWVQSWYDISYTEIYTHPTYHDVIIILSDQSAKPHRPRCFHIPMNRWRFLVCHWHLRSTKGKYAYWTSNQKAGVRLKSGGETLAWIESFSIAVIHLGKNSTNLL